MINFNFHQFQVPRLPEAHKLEELANLIGSQEPKPSSVSEEFRLPENRLPRSVDEIFNDIESGNIQNIIPLEWIVCLHEKEKWDQKNPQRRALTARKIWQASQDKPWLKLRLFWGTVRYWNHQQNGVAPSIAENISAFTPKGNQDKLTFKILSVLSKPKPEKEIARLSCKYNLSPRQLLKKVNLPQEIEAVQNAINYIVDVFFDDIEADIDLLLTCFEEMSRQQELENVEKLLLKISFLEFFPELVDWIKNPYSPQTPNSRWQELSGKAKDNFRKLIGMANYQDFSQLVDRLLEQEKYPQLKSRCYFWSNYSDRFERIRILLPQSTINRLGRYLSDHDYLKLEDDGSEETEVCIFDFGDWFVIEFFRGNGSETRILARYLYPDLFESKTLSVKRLRYLGGECHDHVYCWQNSCEQWLRRRDILPNEGLTNFKINDKRIEPYNPKVGLAAPGTKKLQDRDRQLQRWKNMIAELESEARVYCINRHNG